MSQGTVSLTIDELRVGATCSHPIEDDDGILLLGANTRLTRQVITGLQERGIAAIEVDPRDLATLRGTETKKPVVKRERTNHDGDWVKSKPVKEILIDRHDEGLSEERAQLLKNSMGTAKQQIQKLKEKLSGEKIRSIGQLQEISDAYARSMVDDHDQTISSVGNASKISDLDERSVRMSVLGMAVAIEMGLDGHQTLEVGMVGLLHDIGLHAMDPRFSAPTEQMSDADWWEYQKHPLLSVQCIADVMDIPNSVQLAMQQVHEQFDGSGYPRGVKGKRIHTYARILNVVDAYLQLTTATPTRRAIVPHDALGLLLHQASRGIFDPEVIRAFLKIETLFPLGSMVELTSGELAHVIRRPRSGFAAPVLQGTDGNRIELESASVAIVRPVCDPQINQMRLTQEEMQQSNWHPASPLQLV